MAARLAYLMSRFPKLSETFILREMIALEQQGWPVALYPLIMEREALAHPEAQAWSARARRLPYLSGRLLLDNAGALARQPRSYLAMWGRTLGENYRSGNFLARALALLPRAAYLARSMRADGVTHIHAHFASHPALMAWLVHRLTGISYSVTVHAHDIFVRTAMLATKLRDASFVVAISAYNRDYLQRRLGPWVADKIHIVHCGIEPQRYAQPPQPPQPGQPLEILSIGSLQDYKGQRYLIEACALLRERGLPFRCRIVGEGEQREALEHQIAAAGLGQQAQLMGGRQQSEVAALLATSHCYVQPSVVTPSGKMEGIPVSIMEALACGLPVIASALSGIPELVRADQTGWLVPPGDAQALAEAIAQVYAAPEQARARAQAGRALVMESFNLDTNVRRLAALFEQTLATAGSGGA